MNKKLTKIVGLTLGLSMAVGIGVSINKSVTPLYADEETVSYVATAGNVFGGTISSVNGTSTGTVQLTNSSDTISYDLVGVCTLKSLKSGKSDYRAYLNEYAQIGSSNANVQLDLTAADIPGDITSVDIFAYGSNHTMTVKVDETSYYSQTLGSSAPTSAIHVAPNASGELSISFAATSAKALYFKSISVNYSSGGSSKAAVALSCNNLNLDLGVSTEPVPLNVTATSNEQIVQGLAYTYEVEDDSIASVSSSGYVTPLDIGETELTISFAGNDDYFAASKTISVTVSDSSLDTSNLVFVDKCNGSGIADDNAVWTVTSDGAESTFASDGIHYGTNSASVTYIQLSSSDYKGVIKRVIVTTRDAQATADISVTVGSTSLECSGLTTAKATNTSTAYTFLGNARGEIVVSIDRGESMTKALYVKSIVVIYSEITLSNIALSGTYPLTFTQGDEFSHSGMTVVATYSDNSSENVTAKAKWTGFDMSVAGQQTVTVSFSYKNNTITKTATYGITINSATMYSVSGTIINGSLSSNSDVRENTALNISINAGEKCSRPSSLVVTMGGNALVAGTGYSYDSSTGAFSIPSVTGDVVINGVCDKIAGLWADVPYSIAEAKEAVDLGVNVSNVYVKGIISQVDEYVAGYKSITYWISEDGTTDNQFEVYSGKDFGGADFADINGVRKGAIVIVNGNIKKYNDIYEFNYNNQLIFYSGAVLHATETAGTIDSVSITFNTKISKTLWNLLGSSTEFGMMLFKSNKSNPATVEERYNSDPNKDTAPTKVLVVNGDYGLTLDEFDDYYSMTVDVHSIQSSEYARKFCVAPYLVIGSEHKFLCNMVWSVNSLANNGIIDSELSSSALAALKA